MMHILIIDTDDGFRESLSRILGDAGHSVSVARELGDAKSHCYPGGCDLVIIDLSFQPEILGSLREYNRSVLVVVMSLNPSIESIIFALRMGAFDYLIKPFADKAPLLESVERARRQIEDAGCQRADLKRILKTVSELSFAKEKSWKPDFDDGIKDLYFSQYFEDILGIELARSRRCNHDFFMISVKLNYFNEYSLPEMNAELDRQVEIIAGFLRQRLRRTDVLARTRVDEFMIILAETPKEGGLIVVETLCQGIAAIVPEENSRADRSPEELPFAIGTASYPQDGMDCSVLMAKAHKYL